MALRLSLSLFLVGINLGYSQPSQSWVQRFNGPANLSDEPRAIAVDQNSNVFVTGSSTTASNDSEWITIKYDPSGAGVWTHRYHGAQSGFHSVSALGLCSDGSLWVCGQGNLGGVYAWVTIKYSDGGIPLHTNYFTGVGGGSVAQALVVATNDDVFVAGNTHSLINGFDYALIKYSSSGQPLWTNRVDFGQFDSANAITMDHGGNVVVTGEVDLGNSYTAIGTIKFSGDGLPLWTNLYRAALTSSDSGRAIVVDAQNNVVVTGNSDDTIGLWDYATLKYSGEGIPLWTNRYHGPGADLDAARAIALDSDGNVFVTGFSANTNGGDDQVTIKYFASGVPAWTNRFPDNFGYGIAVNSNGTVFVVGGFGVGFITVAYSNDGATLWTNVYRGPASFSDAPAAMVLDHSGNIYVTGSSTGIGTGQDFATVKYSANLGPCPVSIAPFGNQVVLSWTNAGFGLQSGPDVAGLFTNVPLATSPHTNPVIPGKQFFRLKAY